MKKLLTGVSFFILNVFLQAPIESHALYISVIDIEVNSLRPGSISFKIFHDDLSDAVFHFNQTRYQTTDISGDNYQNAISSYLEQSFEINGDKKPIPIQYDHFTAEGEAIFILGSFELNSGIKDVQVKSNLLTELFPTQANMIHFKWFGKNLFQKLDLKKQVVHFE